MYGNRRVDVHIFFLASSEVVARKVHCIPAKIFDEPHDGYFPSLWVHPGVFTEVLHHVKVGASLLT